MKPNFIFFVTDQHRADHLGCYGNSIVRTPHIDGLAARGTAFDRFYVVSPICMPSRATMMTGRMPSLNGVRHNGLPLPLDSVTIADVLSAGGYRTALIGKSHLQNISEYPPSLVAEAPGAGLTHASGCEEPRRARFDGPEYRQEAPSSWEDPSYGMRLPYYGFDRVDLAIDHGDQSGGDYERWARRHAPDLDRLRGPENAEPDPRYDAPQAWRTRVPAELSTSAFVAERSEQFLDQMAAAGDGRPFFLKCSFPDPHHPFVPPGRYWDMYRPDDVEIPATCVAPDENTPPHVRWLHEQRAAGKANLKGMLAVAVSPAEARSALALTYGLIAQVDDMVGRVLRKAESLGLLDNTVIVFTSDHGDFLGDRGLVFKAPIHYQSLIRVPFIWVDHASAGGARREQALASTLDIARTVLTRAGIAPFNGMQGRDLTRPPSDDLAKDVLIEEDGQRSLFGFQRPPRVRTLVTDRWRYTVYLNSPWGEFYDLREDPGELHNLWDDPARRAQRGELAERMVAKLMAGFDRSPLPTRLA